MHIRVSEVSPRFTSNEICHFVTLNTLVSQFCNANALALPCAAGYAVNGQLSKDTAIG
jgi:hypothetical protein